MIERIKAWAKKSENNSLAFTGFSIILVMLVWFIPFIVIGISKYGFEGKMPITHAYMVIGGIIISFLIGFKFSMTFLFGNK